MQVAGAGYVTAVVVIAALTVAVWDDIIESATTLAAHFATLYSLFCEASASASAPEVDPTAQSRNLLRKMMLGINLSKVWLPLSTVGAIVAAAKLLTDILHDDRKTSCRVRKQNRVRTTQVGISPHTHTHSISS